MSNRSPVKNSTSTRLSSRVTFLHLEISWFYNLNLSKVAHKTYFSASTTRIATEFC
jgi:hypothetical protein